jgi:hypothetical protein
LKARPPCGSGAIATKVRASPMEICIKLLTLTLHYPRAAGCRIMRKPCGIYSRTAFSSQCRPVAGSLKRRLVDRQLSPKPISFDGLGRVPAREQIVHRLVLTGEREP